MKVDLCRNCGAAFDLDEIADGYCLNCLPEPIVGLDVEFPEDEVEPHPFQPRVK
jgi:hypothetical protein